MTTTFEAMPEPICSKKVRTEGRAEERMRGVGKSRYQNQSLFTYKLSDSQRKQRGFRERIALTEIIIECLQTR